MHKSLLLSLVFLSFIGFLSAQTGGGIRGNIFDADSGEPIIFATVQLKGEGEDRGINTDIEGFFSFADLAPGRYELIAQYLGYDSLSVIVDLANLEISYQRLEMRSTAVNLQTVDVSANREKARSDVQISKVTVTTKQIKSLPSTGGEADIAQYLPVLPGIVSSGDQGGQLYIRGGSPVQNKILLDGVTIYNPFHSIGFFSVFETETIRSVDVLTAGFNAEHGGRISAIVDLKTRDGNKKRLTGLVSGSPFQAKALLEGPLVKLNPETGSSISFILTGKHALLDQTSKTLYSYAVDTNLFSFAADTTLRAEDVGLPFQYTDLYGKVSLATGNGTKLDLFGFNFTDDFAITGVAELGWNSSGGGAKFRLVPPNSSVILDGVIYYSTYDISLVESDGAPRQSGITNYGAQLNFTYFGRTNQVNYGFEFNSFNTDFSFRNFIGIPFQQEDFTTELNGYLKYKQKIGNLIIEPGVRVQFYASQSRLSLEPRFGAKLNVSDNFRLKAAGGLYSQNVISTVNDLDVVNFFVGFLAGPEERLFEPDNPTQATRDRLQSAVHGVAGFELDLGKRISLNVEGYYKGFTQLININRNKLSAQDPDFAVETGDAYGGDISIRYDLPHTSVWATYALGYVNRDDGQQEYPATFDRRHNVNLLVTHQFGAEKLWEVGARWNLGSPFPFTQTQGFYQNVPVQQNPLLIDVLTGNFNLDPLLDEELNGGRLSYFHRLDLSLKRTFNFSQNLSLDVTASVTNVYDRENIFYVDRLTNRRVNQLPVLPALGATIHF